MQRNIRLLILFRTLSAASFAASILVIFFQQIGINLAQGMLLQAIFALTALACEIPSGYLADRWSRRGSLLLGSTLGLVGYSLYATADGWWSVVAAEMLLGVGLSCISGADSALAYDSLAAINKREQYKRYEIRASRYAFGSAMIAAIAGGLMADHWDLRSTLVVEALSYIGVLLAAWCLVEPARQQHSIKTNPIKDVLRITKYALHGHAEIASFIAFCAVVGTSTHTMFWLSQPFYQALGLSLTFFGVVAAIRQAAMMLATHVAEQYEYRLGRTAALGSFVGIVSICYIVLAFNFELWALVLLLGFDFVRAVYTPIARDQLNAMVNSDIRATVLSVQTFTQRLFYSIVGPVVGWIASSFSLRASLLFSAALYGVLGFLSFKLFTKRNHSA